MGVGSVAVCSCLRNKPCFSNFGLLTCEHSTMPRHAFTIRELIAVITLLLLTACIVAIAAPRGRAEARRQRDGSQVRAIQLGLVLFAQGGPDSFTLPSYFDKANNTLALPARQKDTTANIYSMMVFNGTLAPEVLVSPVETNPRIRPCFEYQYDKVAGAAHPEQATWDPKLSAALDGSSTGNVSYAHLQPAGERKRRWSNTFSSQEVVISNRGPQVASVSANPDLSVTPTLALPNSNTLRFYGRGRAWSGWAAFNDGHVDFRSEYLTSGKRFAESKDPFVPA